jgi:transposase
MSTLPENLGKHLSIDETSLSQDELYMIVTNKAPHGKKGAIVAIIGISAKKIFSAFWACFHCF